MPPFASQTPPLAEAPIAEGAVASVLPTLDEVFRAEGAFVLRTIKRLGVEASDAEDLTQQVFIVLHRRPELLGGGASVRSVLFGILRRVVAGHRRQKHRAHSELPELTIEPQQEQLVDRKKARMLLESAMELLDPAKREVFVLYELEGLDMPQAAATLGVALQTAYTRLHAARTIVQRVLARAMRRKEGP